MIHLVQGSEEWKRFREGKITASIVPAIMGESPFQTPYSVWCEKVGLTPPIETNAAMQRGINLEPQARECFSKYSGIRVQPAVVIHEEFDWLMASLDGLSSDGQYGVEIKCPGQNDHDLAKSGKVPIKYYGQLQCQMFCANLKNIIYFSYVSDDDHVLIEVFRDEEYIDMMMAACHYFYDCMQNLEAPPLCDRDYVDMSKNVDFVGWAKEYKRINDEIIELEKKKANIKDLLIAIADDRPASYGKFKLSKVIKKGAIAYEKIPQLSGIDLNLYRKESVDYWKILTGKD